MRFKERRSGLTVDLEITGWMERADTTEECFDYWMPGELPLWSTYGATCSFNRIGGAGASLRLASTQLERLVAGRWDASLILDLRIAPGDAPVASYTFTFDFTITDHDRVSIYFPEYDQATPHVGLNVKYNPIGIPSIGGKRELEMCLYDGLGSQSQYLDVTISDTGRPASGRPPDTFSVWHEAGGSDVRDRLDYRVWLNHAGARMPMQNGRLQSLTGIDTADLRLVVLPGMSQPVYCVPTPLSLEMDPVPAASKANGHYEGNLQILMNVPTTTP